MKYSCKKILTSDNKFIHVYDGLFNYNEKINFFYFLNDSSFQINGGDHSETNYISKQIFCKLNNDDLKKLNIVDAEGFKFLNQEYEIFSRNCKQIRVNCSNSFEYNTPHTDGDGITLIYYSNLDWNLNWGGHTIFLDNELQEIEYTSLLRPGRLVVFDSNIPHSISPISTACNTFRLSLVFQFTNKPSVVQSG